jgi:hypothetical protein
MLDDRDGDGNTHGYERLPDQQLVVAAHKREGCWLTIS